MFIGQATLKSAAFCPRLTLLIADFREAGYTVWLEGMDLRFDCISAQTCAQPDDLGVLMRRYRDIVDWGPSAASEVAVATESTRQPSTPPRWVQRFAKRGFGVKSG